MPYSAPVPAATTPSATTSAGVPAADPFDHEWAQSMVREVLAPMSDTWFRARIIGAEHVPETGPVILAANHSGNAFPYDAIVLDSLLWRLGGMGAGAKWRTVYEYGLSLRWWMRPFGVANFWRRGGGVDMTFDNFDRLLARGDRVLYFPEGVPGIGKGFNHRYELQRFSTSFLLLAARHQVPVCPVHIVNAEWVHPFGYTFKPIDWLFAHVFGVPFLPLPIGLLAIVFPWIWYLAFPARLVIVVGKPLDVTGALQAEGVTSLDDPDRGALRKAARRVRMHVQAELDAAVRAHGNTRYGFGSLWRALRAARPHALRATPLGWPVAFIRHERDRQRPPARNRLHAILRDCDLAAFYLPFGWPLLSLARWLRRPPYGYRGVPRARRRELEGNFLWRLGDRPLPPRA
jgi:1-acyl-sn-glycerol-3-phosphate acyltransferase